MILRIIKGNKRNRMLRRIAALLCASMLLSVSRHSLSPALADAPVYARLVVPVFFEEVIPSDFDLVEAEVNRIAQTKIGVSVDLIPLLYLYRANDPLREAALDMLGKQGISIDLFPSVVKDITPLPLDDLLAQYGQSILEVQGEFGWPSPPTKGPIYQLSALNDHIATMGLTMRRDIVEKYGIDISSLRSFADLDKLFAFVSEREPGLKMVCPYLTRLTLISRYRQTLLEPNSILAVAAGNPGQVINYYADVAYLEKLRLIREWFQAGYLPENLSMQNLRASQLVRADKLFSYICAYKPGIDFEESKSCGMPMVTVSLMEPMVTRESMGSAQWSIASTCTNPGKAMQFLSLLYTDSQLVNLLLYGVEGIHYVLLEDGTIDYPPGVTADTVGYLNTLPWLIPNQTIARLWRGNAPDLWEQLYTFHKSAPRSSTLTFAFDEGLLTLQCARIRAIIAQYVYGLETGQLDPDLYLPLLLAEMETAGASAVLEEAQKQLDGFLKVGPQ